MNFLRMQKEVFRLRGELQNDSISGVSSDERQKVKDDLNKEMRKISNDSPPFLKTEFHLKTRSSVTLTNTTGDNTATATEGIPQVIDSASNLTTRNKYWLLSDGTHRYRAINIVGTTYSLDFGSVANTSTTATAWVAYKDSYPIPHNCGRIMDMFIEDGDRTISLLHGTQFRTTSRLVQRTGNNPTQASVEVFTNRWSKFKFSVTGVTATNDSIEISVGTTDASYFDWGDNLLVDTATTDEHLHTVMGINETSGVVYLDRPYSGSTGQVTLYTNPVEHTRYINLYMIPDAEKDVVLEAYLWPQNLISDTDECIFNEDVCWAIVYGAIKADSISRSFLNEQQLAQYDEALRNLKQTPYANIKQSQPRQRLGGNRTFRSSDIG